MTCPAVQHLTSLLNVLAIRSPSFISSPFVANGVYVLLYYYKLAQFVSHRVTRMVVKSVLRLVSNGLLVACTWIVPGLPVSCIIQEVLYNPGITQLYELLRLTYDKRS